MTETWASSNYKPAAGSIPHAPGVYRFRDADDTVVYVGKAKFLDARLSNYFGNPEKLHPRTRKMVETATSVSWIVCASESEALVLEQTWIHKYRPRFNVAMKNSDSKYPSLAITNEKVPRILPWRGERKKGLRYYGPYPAVSTRELMDALLHAFPMRSCNNNTFKRAKASGRPCLLGDIGKCAAPCVGRVSESEHQKIVEKTSAFLSGHHEEALKALKDEMQEAASNLDFEKAARRRDEITALTATFERQRAVNSSNINADAVATFESDVSERIGVAQVIVRNGIITGARTWSSERDPLLSRDEQLEQVLGELYADADALPDWLLLERFTPGCVALGELFQAKGKTVKIRAPKSGTQLDILSAASRNAQAALESGAVKRAASIEDRTAALEEIGEVTGVGKTPWRIECIDIAHISGTSPVASVVVFEDGKPALNEYRKLNLSDDLGGDDFEGMREAVTKRFSSREAGMRRRPDLLIVDGGSGQVQAALEALQALGVTSVALCGLAKRLEEIWVPGEDAPLILSRNSDALLLLQHIRDEAHRVANSAHRKRRERKALLTALNEVPGLGPKKRASLIEAFGTVEAIASASASDLRSIEGIGPSLAATLKKHLS